MAKADGDAACSLIGATTIKTTSSSFFHQLRSYVKSKSMGDIWSDFVGGGADADTFTNANDQKPSDLGNLNVMGFKNGAQFSFACTKMDSTADYLLDGTDCSGEAHTACVKPVCPSGFEYLNNERCVKLVDTAADKATAEADCKTGQVKGSLFAPKSRQEQLELDLFLSKKTTTDDIYLGITQNSDSHWVYDEDQSPVFSQCKFSGSRLKYFVVCNKKSQFDFADKSRRRQIQTFDPNNN